ncbi:MAG: TetR/AcrR family transcriptional regulator [Nitrospirae bacterium]|nr:MAG: TetR/AcrR family transcriptional regulator [Nitrospirota bacterium]
MITAFDKKTATGGNRRERKKEDTKLKIINVALRLFQGQSFDVTTMEQIADEADIAKGTLYNYFPVKEAIISEYWQNSVDELKPQAAKLIQSLPDTKARLNSLFKKTAEFLKAHQDITNAYIRYRMQGMGNCERNKSLRSGFEGILVSIISTGQKAGDIRQDINAEQLARYLEMMYLLVCLMWLSGPDMFPLEKNLKQMVDLFLSGAKSNREAK